MAKKYYDGKEQAYQMIEMTIEEIFDSVMEDEYKRGIILFTKKSDELLYLEMAQEVNAEVESYIKATSYLHEVCRNKIIEVSEFYNNKFKSTITE